MANYRSAAGRMPFHIDALCHNLNILGDVIFMLPCTEQSGTTLSDVSLRSHDLTAAVDVSTYYGTGGRALRYLTFDGATTYASVADDPDFSFRGAGDIAFSIMAMVRVTAATTGTLLSKWDVTGGAEAREWNFDLNASAPRLSIYDETNNDGFDTVANAAISDNVWHLLVMTYDGSALVTGITPYVDGLPVAHTDTAAGGAYTNMRDTVTDVYMGAHVDTAAATNLYAGDVSWVALTSKELSATEVWTLWSRMSNMAGV